MKHTLIALALAVLAGHSHARCIANDAWTGRDKDMHLKAGLAIGAGVTLITRDPRYGFWAGTAAGALAELKDARTPGHVCSLQDFAVTAAGAAAGAYGVGWFLVPQKHGVQVAFAKTF